MRCFYGEYIVELIVNGNDGNFQYKTETKTSRVPCVDEYIEFLDTEEKKKCAKVISVFHLGTHEKITSARIFVNLV